MGLTADLSTALRSGRDDNFVAAGVKGRAVLFIECRGWMGKQQVPPLRYAPVGMTILGLCSRSKVGKLLPAKGGVFNLKKTGLSYHRV
jgi:hypothetical protein